MICRKGCLKNQNFLCLLFLLFFYFDIPITTFSFSKGIAPNRENTKQSESLPTFDQVLDSMDVRFNQIDDYQVTMDIVMNVKGIHIPPMLVTIFYKQPDKLHFESRGFAVFPRNAVMFSPAQFRELAIEGKVLSVENFDQNKTVHLLFFPPVKDKNIEIRMDFWVDIKTWTIMKLRTESNRFGWIEVNNQYQWIDKKFWLPKQSIITMEINKNAITKFRTQIPMDPDSRKSKIPSILDDFFGTGQMYITFRNYKINSGLSDELFQ